MKKISFITLFLFIGINLFAQFSEESLEKMLQLKNVYKTQIDSFSTLNSLPTSNAKSNTLNDSVYSVISDIFVPTFDFQHFYSCLFYVNQNPKCDTKIYTISITTRETLHKYLLEKLIAYFQLEWNSERMCYYNSNITVDVETYGIFKTIVISDSKFLTFFNDLK